MHPGHREVVKELGPVAKKRNNAFQWDATDYTNSRGNAGDQEHLERVCQVLLILVKHARNGYLRHKGLCATLMSLDLEHNVFDLADASKRFSVANRVADGQCDVETAVSDQ